MPFWNTLEEVNLVYRNISTFGLITGLVAAVFAFLSAFSAVGGYYYGSRKDELQNMASAAELDKIRSKIQTFTLKLYVEYSWDSPNNPLIYQSDGGGIGGEEDHIQLIRENSQTGIPEELFFKRVNQYKIFKISDNGASFEVDLVARASGFPVGFQIKDLNEIKSFITYIPVKNYWMNGRDKYKIRINKIILELFVNGEKRIYSFDEQEEVLPKLVYSDVIWGYLTPVRKFSFESYKRQ